MHKKVTLISPILNESALLPDAISNLESFVQKIPLNWQWILANSGHDAGLVNLKSDKIEIKILNLPKNTERAPALQKALLASDGDFIAIIPVDFTIPLAELFSFLQELVTADDVDIAIGNRYTSKKAMQSLRSSWHQTLEKILNEKNRSLPETDALCGYMIFKRSALNILLPELKLKSWYYSLDILKLAHTKNLKVIQVPILARDKRNSKIPLFREYLRHLF